MSTWQDRAKIAVHDVLSVGNIARWGWLFVSGARWQREALLADEAVERAARAIARAENADYWAEEIDRHRAASEARAVGPHRRHHWKRPCQRQPDRGVGANA